MRRSLIFIIFLLFTWLDLAFAAKPVVSVNQKPLLKIDSSAVSPRYFQKDSLAAYSKQQEFQYGEVEAHDSLWTRFWRWFGHWLEGLFNFSKNSHLSGFWSFVWTLLEYLILIAGGAALIFFILKLTGFDIRNILGRKPTSVGIPYDETLENIHEINFDEQIEKAIAALNYRLAVRLLYLKCLKQLSDASLIKWQPEKTNSSYVTELSNSMQGTTFKILTRSFEYIWYGDFVIDAPVFKNIHSQFQEFKDSIK